MVQDFGSATEIARNRASPELPDPPGDVLSDYRTHQPAAAEEVIRNRGCVLLGPHSLQYSYSKEWGARLVTVLLVRYRQNISSESCQGGQDTVNLMFFSCKVNWQTGPLL